MDNIIRPTARLDESEAYERMEFYRRTTGQTMAGYSAVLVHETKAITAPVKFAKDWNKMIRREGLPVRS